MINVKIHDMMYAWYMSFLDGRSWVMDPSWVSYIYVLVYVYTRLDPR